jgi:cyclic pyranopterin phosphate synthase
MSNFQLDGTKIHHHLDAVARWQRGEQVYPILLEVSPVTACNHACTFCAYDYIHRDKTRLDPKRLCEVYDELAPLGTKSVFYAGEGEPLLHKQLPDVIEHGARLGLDQALNTNATALTGKTLERILPHLEYVRVSLNGVNAADYAKVHVVREEHYGMVLRHLEEAVAFKRREGLKCSIGVQLVYLNQPVAELYDHAVRVKALGVDYFSVKQFNPHPRNPFKLDRPVPAAEEFERLRELKDDGFHLHLRVGLVKPEEWARPYKRCLSLPFFAEIVANGEVYACGPHLGEKDFCYGSIYDTDFKTMWSKAGRAGVQGHVDSIENLDHVCMPNCRLDQVNRFLWDLQQPPDHVNFI